MRIDKENILYILSMQALSNFDGLLRFQIILLILHILNTCNGIVGVHT